MAHFDDISDEVRVSIASQAFPLIARHDRTALGAPGQPMVLGTSLREEMLTLGAIRGTEQVSMQETGQTLSVLSAPGEHVPLGAGPGEAAREVGYVLARPRTGVELGTAAPEEWSVSAVSASNLAARIQSALLWIDENVDGDPLVRVLSIPSFQLTALALHRDDDVVGVVALPTASDTRFEPNHVYEMDEFIGRLRDLPSAEGLVFD